ncbi:unnamed protein product [Cutaneotrichosporon oleaginosum]
MLVLPFSPHVILIIFSFAHNVVWSEAESTTLPWQSRRVAIVASHLSQDGGRIADDDTEVTRASAHEGSYDGTLAHILINNTAITNGAVAIIVLVLACHSVLPDNQALQPDEQRDVALRDTFRPSLPLEVWVRILSLPSPRRSPCPPFR